MDDMGWTKNKTTLLFYKMQISYGGTNGKNKLCLRCLIVFLLTSGCIKA
jgi:hypothetical protein